MFTAREVRRHSASDAALLHPDEASRKRRVGVPDHESFHTSEQGQHDRLAGRTGAISLITGRCCVYNFRRRSWSSVRMQIEAMIDQNTTISQQLTLWDQKGSK